MKVSRHLWKQRDEDKIPNRLSGKLREVANQELVFAAPK